MSLIVSIVAASLLNVPWIAVSPCSTFRRVTRPLIGATIVVLLELALRVAIRGGRLIDRVVRRLELRLRHFDLRAQLLDLLVGDERRIRLLERQQAIVVALRLIERRPFACAACDRARRDGGASLARRCLGTATDRSPGGTDPWSPSGLPSPRDGRCGR